MVGLQQLCFGFGDLAVASVGKPNLVAQRKDDGADGFDFDDVLRNRITMQVRNFAFDVGQLAVL